MKKAEIKKLSRFLDDPARADGTFRFHELQGFLFAIAASPDTIAPSEWLPLISNDEGLNFADIEEAREIMNLVMALYNEVNAGVLERSKALPAGCAFDGNLLRNFEDDSSISQWSRGFASGHDWLSEVWEKYLFDELEEECGVTVLVLSFFGSRRLAKAYYADLQRDKGKGGDKSFEEFAKTMHKMFPDALASYAHLGRSIFEAVLEQNAESRKPAASTKVGRNELCPCGSGRKYKKCCGGVVH